MIKIQFLVENKTDTDLCDAEHGLSIYIETPQKILLFDAGASSDLMIKNAQKLGVDLSKVDAGVVSHGHFDHTGGFPAFAKQNTKAKILIHKNAFAESYGTENGKPDPEPCSIQWTTRDFKLLEDRMELTNGPLWMTDDIVISGTIPKHPEEKQTELFLIKKPDGSMVTDEMNHEQFLAVRNRDSNNKPDGIILFSGCSHSGIFAAIEYTKKLFPGEQIRVMVAGMHLYHASAEEREAVLMKLEIEGITTILPVHCTGIEAICAFHNRLKDRCPIATVGKTYQF